MLACSFAIAACASSRPSVFPSGTYAYASNVANVPIDSTVTVSRDATAIIVNEQYTFVKLPNVPAVSIVSRLDPATFSVISYAVDNDPEGPDPSLTITPSGATYSVAGKKPVVQKAPVAAAPSWVFDTNRASAFAAVPAILHATGAKVINGYVPEIFKGSGMAWAFVPTDATVSRPEGVPAGDASLALAFHTRKMAMTTLWYDPATFVVSGVKIGNDTLWVRKN